MDGNTQNFDNENIYDAIVVGAGHAGVESALALSRIGCKTLCLSVTLDNVGYLACNPSIGGTAKGHLVREIDALGGEMGIAADKTLTQLRMLNSSKGPAVRSLRAQVDKYAYHNYMKSVLENQPNLSLRQGEVKELLFDENGDFAGIKTVLGQTFAARAAVLACGVYLKSTIIVGDVIEQKGPVCFCRANHLSDSLESAGIALRRFKTGTPARVKRSSIDLQKLEVQPGEDVPYTFSSTVKRTKAQRDVCYLGFTNERTHDIIRESLHLSPKYSGLIHGTGARYCPSIEDKIVRFADKTRHQFFLEPEGDGTQEMYVQGISTALPPDVQKRMYRSIEGFEKIEIMRDAYAIEYDCIDPRELNATLMHKRRKGLFFAGQINGTSGYEEAAAQGLVAGINAARYCKGKEGIVFARDNSYIGVLVDDLVTKGADEPYRMMTGRAEYRLLLRQDNAMRRLTPIGIEAGLVTGRRLGAFKRYMKDYAAAEGMLERVVCAQTADAVLTKSGMPAGGCAMTCGELLRRGADERELLSSGAIGDVRRDVLSELACEVRYAGYIEREKRRMANSARVNNARLPEDFDYSTIGGLRLEAREKLNKVKPLTVGQAANISGVTPADVNVLILKFLSQKK